MIATKDMRRKAEFIRKMAKKTNKYLKNQHLLYDPHFISSVETQAEAAKMTFEFYVKNVMLNHGREVMDLRMLATYTGRSIAMHAARRAKKFRQKASSSSITKELKMFKDKVAELDGDAIQAFIDISPFLSPRAKKVILSELDPRTRSLLELYMSNMRISDEHR